MAKKLPPSVQGLLPTGTIDSGLQREFALRGRDERQLQAQNQKVDTAVAGNADERYYRNASAGDIGGLGHEWGPFFQALQEGHTNITGAPDLRTDPNQGTVPLSMQGLDGMLYGYDGTRPTSMTFKKGTR